MGLEEQLCLLLARARSSPEADDNARHLLAGRLDWNRVMQLVRAHEILPVVWRNLKRLSFPGVPQSVEAELTDLFRHNALRNSLFAAELAHVLSALADAQVPAMPLKGIAAAESLYGDAAMRVCADIDVLVPPKYFPVAFNALRSLGYCADFAQPRLAGLIARYGKDCGLMRQDGTRWYPLQLHAGLIWGGPAERMLSEQIWAAAQQEDFHGTPAFAMTAEWQFLYFAVHAARHGLSCLKWLVDLDQLCTRPGVDWDWVNREARQLEWQRVIQSTLATCALLLETPVPEALSEPSRREPNTASAISLSAAASGVEIPQENLFAVRLLRSWPQRISFVAARLFVPTSRDCQTVPLPEPLFFLYYALRPIRLAGLTVVWVVRAALHFIRRTPGRNEVEGRAAPAWS